MHTPNLALWKFTVKVVRHRKRLWKAVGNVRGQIITDAFKPSHGSSGITIPGLKLSGPAVIIAGSLFGTPRG